MAIALYPGTCAGLSWWPASPWMSCRVGIDSGQGLATGSTLSIAPVFCLPVLNAESFGFCVWRKCLATGFPGVCGRNIPHLLALPTQDLPTRPSDWGLSVAEDLNLALASCYFL